MSWILGGIYCGAIWLVFAKLKLLRLSLPLAILLASLGPSMIVVLLFCAQYFHPYTSLAIVIEQVDSITPQLSRPGRVTEILIQPNVSIKQGDVLFRVDPVPYENTVRRSEASLERAKQNIDLAESTVTLSSATLDRANSDLAYAKNNFERYEKLRQSGGASQDEFDRATTQYQQSLAAVSQAEQSLKQSQLSVDVAIASVTESEVALSQAKYDLEQTSTLAPADGFVTNLQLRPGMLVGGSSGAVMTFVRQHSSDNQGIVVATFGEKNYLQIQPGQYAEVAMAGYPGAILTGRVLNTIDVSGKGQIAVGGTLPDSLVDAQPTLFAVRIQLDDKQIRLPGGARGQVAVYSDRVQVAGIPIMFLIRAKSWMNYLM